MSTLNPNTPLQPCCAGTAKAGCVVMLFIFFASPTHQKNATTCLPPPPDSTATQNLAWTLPGLLLEPGSCVDKLSIIRILSPSMLPEPRTVPPLGLSLCFGFPLDQGADSMEHLVLFTSVTTTSSSFFPSLSQGSHLLASQALIP